MRFQQTSISLVGLNSLNSNYTSPSIVIFDSVNQAIQAVWAGTAGSLVGSFQLQASFDNSIFANIGGAIAVSGDGSYMWNNLYAVYPYARLVFTRTSGTGTLTSLKIGIKVD